MKEMISLTALKNKIKENRAFLVDIREQSERQDGFVPGSLHLPFSTIDEDTVDERLPKDKEIYLHCQSGRRAELAVHLLRKNYPQVHAVPYNFEEINSAD